MPQTPRQKSQTNLGLSENALLCVIIDIVMKKYIKKADIILLIVLVVIGLAFSALIATSKTGGDTVIIERFGKVYGKYALNKDAEIDVMSGDSITPELHVSIKGGYAKVTGSTCQNKICVRHSAINSVGESIVCLPGKTIIKIEGKGGGYDAITN